MSNNRSHFLSPRWHDTLYWGLLVALCAVFCVLNLWTSFKEDDMEFSLLRDAGLMDFLRSQYDHYMTSNGRCADFFATLFCAYLGKPVFNVVNTVVFGLMAHLVSLLATGRRSVTVLAMFAAYVGVSYPVPGQTLLFVAGSCNYMWAIVASLMVAYLLRRCRETRMGWGRTLPLMLLAFVAGNFNEATSFGFLGGLTLYYAVNRKLVNRTVVLVMLAYLLGVLFIMGSPGAWHRVSIGGIAVNMSLRELLASRSVIFIEKMCRIVTPIVAVMVGIVMVFLKRRGSIRRNCWAYILFCQAFVMLVLGYLYDRAYAPLATVAFIIVAMAALALLSRRRAGDRARVAVIAVCLLLSALVYSREMKALSALKAFENQIEREIAAAPSHAILRERRFNTPTRFGTPLRYASFDFFNREATYCAYYGKENVQFVNDSIYNRYHSGRLLDGAQLLPLASDRPEVADTVLRFPDLDYMVVVLNADTLMPSPQLANYFHYRAEDALSEQDRQYRAKYGLNTDYTLRSYFPLYYKRKHLLVLPLIDEATSRIVLQLDYDGTLGDMTLSRVNATTRKD